MRGRPSCENSVFLCEDFRGRDLASAACTASESAVSPPVPPPPVPAWVEREGYFVVLRSPPREAPDGKGLLWANRLCATLRLVGNSGTGSSVRFGTHRGALAAPRARMRRIACRPFGAQARSQPTRVIRSPLTRRHVRLDQRHPTNHAPRAQGHASKWRHREAPLQHR